MSAFRHPVVAVSHGPGPLWLLSSGFAGMSKSSVPAQTLTTTFEKLYPNGENLPKRILYVSAHWESESSGFEISNAANPDMIYDYYGFPQEAYDVVYPAKGDPAFAQKAKEQLEKNNLKAKLVNRGFDHGVFVPMLLIRPQADIPIVTMSINSRLGSKTHFDLGKAIAPFRDEDTLILCSGQATHNMRASRDPNNPIVDWAAAFQGWLDNTLTAESKLSYSQRGDQIIHWDAAPAARLAHPTPDHFIPFVTATGAGMEESKPEAEKVFGGWGMGHMSFATYAWGVAH
ncbi:UDP-N-acetylglucosamine--peptide N-acetylglucosaminyltransferase SEC [Phytophthora cinnamomi]|uniref:UDP-N-acetylglucosamine--peptide N-acetylglucosaminyltransferase SEC n=1 Tax=Phytophthora cinnamomi TaxID=4785 RepID=UPI00355995A8|nr:UDP-N-acetylglucosamine--peptide N-acetylglucosaminyltransferase SEC [Phytophthora cinnamomi]